MPANDKNWLDYAFNDNPKCPHCDAVMDIDDNELYDLYRDGDHEMECTYCEKEIQVTTNVEYTFSTCKKEEE